MSNYEIVCSNYIMPGIMIRCNHLGAYVYRINIFLDSPLRITVYRPYVGIKPVNWIRLLDQMLPNIFISFQISKLQYMDLQKNENRDIIIKYSTSDKYRNHKFVNYSSE